MTPRITSYTENICLSPSCAPMAPVKQDSNSLLDLVNIEDSACLAVQKEQERLKSRIRSCRNPADSNVSCSYSYFWREKVAQWCYDVIDHLVENRDLAYVAMNILDRFTNHRILDERCYEVAAMSALFLAVRVGGSAKLSISGLISMSHLNIEPSEIVATGKSMISELHWDHRMLTPATFIRALVRGMSSRLSASLLDSLEDTALYTADLAVFDVVLSRKRPSLLGGVAIISAIKQHNIIPVELKVELISLIKSSTARFGDTSELQDRFSLLTQGIPNGNQPHIILDDEDE